MNDKAHQETLDSMRQHAKSMYSRRHNQAAVRLNWLANTLERIAQRVTTWLRARAQSK